MESTFLKDLNSQQKEAVLHTDGPMVILAGAGSGKTRCITYKVLHLINQGVNPLNILCVTFTNKAANEMKERVIRYLNSSHVSVNSHPTIATFHSLCAKILRVEGKYIGLSPQFAIYDTQDQLDAVKEAMNRLSISAKEYKPSSLLASISQAKNELLDFSEYSGIAKGHFQEVTAKVYAVYQHMLKENDAVDFDDLLLKTVYLFKTTPSILEKYQNRFKYILVDEYQDTNHAQYFLTKLLAAKWKNICVVGDFAQSIYSWRGADFQNLTKFKKDFPQVKTFQLDQNYRSTQNILDAAYSIISRNTTHPVLSLWTENPEGEGIIVFESQNEHKEAEFIIQQMATMKYQNPDFNFSDFAVLYRTNAQSRTIEEVFLHHGIPYRLVGGTRFYERKEIKDVLAYLRLLQNPKDSISYKRIEKLGKGRLQKFLDFQTSFSLEKSENTLEILDTVLEKTNYLSLYDEDDEEDRQRLENIKELRSVALEFTNLTEFLENVALVEQEQLPDHPLAADTQNVVTLMTLHAAKGLEFQFVFMVGMEEGLFPHSRALMDRSELEEERRLCYVGVTRAKKKLFLTYARKRLFFGQRTSNTVSRFIMELPEKVLSANLEYRSIHNEPDSDYI